MSPFINAYLVDMQLVCQKLIAIRRINTNTYKACFWTLAYLLQEPALVDRIRNEITPGVVNGTIDINHLMNHCPRLEAAFSEVLRLSVSSASMRYITKTTEIGGKTLRSGNKLIIPYRQLHYNEDVYGANALQFDPDRFLKDGDLSRNASYRPFGGGSTYCPGRFIARQEVVTFVALVLHRFDIELAEKDGIPQPFPRLDEGKPCLGVMGPAAGNDLIVRVKPSGR